tara:strand:+ start:133 stop:528 length:396 start_codon:yes stop_codon:yes gene_type:complete
MAAEYKHKRYFRLRAQDVTGDEDTPGLLKAFSSTGDANTKIGFTSIWDTSSPTKTLVLADSDKTLVVTYEFDSADDQTAFKSAIDTAFADATADDMRAVTDPATDTDSVEHFKTEWLHKDGSVSSTSNLID